MEVSVCVSMQASQSILYPLVVGREHTRTQKKKVLGRRLSQRAHDAHGNVSPHQCGFELTSPSLDSGGDATMKANEAGSSGAAACPASAGNSRERERRKGK